MIPQLQAAWALRWPIALAVALAGAGVQTWRLDRAHATLAEERAGLQAAADKSEILGLITGRDAVANYVERTDAEAPVVERVVERVRNICVRPPADRRVPMPDAPGRTDVAPARDADAADRAFVAAIEHDLAMCAGEVQRLRALQEWIEANR